jgi:membrane protein
VKRVTSLPGAAARHAGEPETVNPGTAARWQGRLRRLVDAADRLQQRHGWLAFPIALQQKFSGDQGGSLVALIAYYGFLSVVPLLLAFAAILGFVMAGHPGFESQVLQTVERDFPSLSGYLSRTIKGSELALGIGLGGALWAGLGVTLATERAMNAVWYVPLCDRPKVWWSRLRGLGLLAALGVTFLLSAALASLQGIGGPLAIPAALLGITGSLTLNGVLFLVAFQVLTNRHLAWRSLLPGALVGAVGWTALQSLGVLYVGHEVAHASTLYGSLAAVIGLVAWLYLGARLTVYAAEVNAVLSYRLWPRSLTAGLRTDADRRAFTHLAEESRRAKDEMIEVSFGQAGRFDGEQSQ